MSSARSKKQDSLQELRTGTVQRLSQHFLQASLSQSATGVSGTAKPPSSPIRYQPLAIPQTFMVEGNHSSSSCPLTPPPPPPPSSSSSTFSFSSSYDRYSSSALSPLSSVHSNRGSSSTIGTDLNTRQSSAQQFCLRPASPHVAHPSSLPSSSSQSSSTSHLPQCHVVGFVNSKDLIGGISLSSVGSEDSFVTAHSQIDSPKEPGSPVRVPLWKQMLDAIEQEDRPELDRILHAFDFAIVIQTLVTWNVSNTDNKYRHDPDVLLDAKELLGPTVDHLNLIQIACFLFNEEMALDLLNFVAKASEELESKKILYEFMGKMWGDGNTTLHLASFLGMADLTKRLLDLGANVYKMNDRKYKPVDCADENTTRSLFLNLTEVVRYRRIAQESLPISPISDSGSEFNWGSFRSMGHLRSPSTSTLPLLMLASEDLRAMQNSESISDSLSSNTNNNIQLMRPASTLGIAGQQRKGLLITEPHQGESISLKSSGSQTGSQSGSASDIDNLLLTESSALQMQEEESILSPMVIFKSSTSLHGGSSIPDSSGNSTNGSTDFADASEGGSIDRMQRNNTSTSSTTTSSSYASHIRPKLRSYQSSPSIRLYAEQTATKDTNGSSTPKKTKNTKRVSFDPPSLMADASRSGDLSLYKSMLALVQEQTTSGTLEEIINHQSASRKLSSLHLAASYNHLALCQFLVEMGANVNLTDMEGWTPMHCAAAEGHLRVFEFLAKAPDADLQVATYDGELLEDVVEDDELRQEVIDIIEAQSRG